MSDRDKVTYMAAFLVVLGMAIAGIIIDNRMEKEMEQSWERPWETSEITEVVAAVSGSSKQAAGIGAVFEEWQNEAEKQEEKMMQGFSFYEIPEEYAQCGGELPEEVQRYIYRLCREEKVRYALILAMIEQESGYKSSSIGDDGESFGYMQISERNNEDRMERLGVDDLLDPYQNIRVGVDIIKEHINRYHTIQDALAAYNYGVQGAWDNLWSKEIYVYSYNETIMRRMKEIEEVLGSE